MTDEAVQMVLTNETINKKVMRPLRNKVVYPIILYNIVFNLILLSILGYIAYKM
jgi:hypothetical protein